MLAAIGLSTLDAIALALFLLAWLGFEWGQRMPGLHQRSITFQMDQFREHWMRNMVRRDQRVMDQISQSTLQSSVGFFASTAMLVIGALIAGLGASDQALNLLANLPLAVETSSSVWHLKMLLLLFIFVFAFFKFAWSMRLFSYVTILVGASPDYEIDVRSSDAEINQRLDRYALRVARLHALAASHFSTGINAFYFAIAALGWLLNPWVFIGATLWVWLVIYRRTFHSRFMRILTEA